MLLRILNVKNKHMYLSISTNIFAALPVEEALARIEQIGIREIEVHALHLSQARHRPAAVRRMVEKNGLKVSSVHSPTMDKDFLGKTSPAFKQEYRDYYVPLFATAADIGTSIFVDHLEKANRHKKNSYRLLKKQIFENLYLLAELAAGYGITIALENSSGDNCLHSPERFKEVLSRVGHPNLKVNLDVGHARCNRISPQRFINLVGSDIVNLHIQGFKAAGVIGKLETLGYEGAVVLEHEEHRLRDAFQKALAELGKTNLPPVEINIGAMPVLNQLRIPKGWKP